MTESPPADAVSPPFGALPPPHGPGPGGPGRRMACLAGIAGPAAFIAAWTICGAATDGYSPIDDAISELAAIGAPTRLAMSLGFFAFALGTWLYAGPLGRTIGGGTGPALRVAAVATAGAAVFPLGDEPWATIHGVFAGVGYAALVAVPALAARRLASGGSHRVATASLAASALGGACLVLSLVSDDNGLWQRFGLTTLDLWVIASAVVLLRRPALR